MNPAALGAFSLWIRSHDRPETADPVEIVASVGEGWRARLLKVLNECARSP